MLSPDPDARAAAAPALRPAAILEEREFRLLAALIEQTAGIRMPPSKRALLQARLHKRLRALGLCSFRAYCEHLSRDGGDELRHMLDAVTTNKTEFFRDPGHFRHLAERAIPVLAADGERGLTRPLRVLSAGCATGEEVWSLAISLAELAAGGPGLRFEVVGVDLSARALERARLAVYDEGRVAGLEGERRRRWFMRSRDRARRQVRVVPELRAAARFERLNLLGGELHALGGFDVIFCRNVMIYFDRARQQRLVAGLHDLLRPDGYLYVGLSESVARQHLPLTLAAPSVYQRAAAGAAAEVR